MRSSVGVGRAVSSQTDVFAAPLLAYDQPGTVPGVIYCHGAGDSATSPTDSINRSGEYPIFDALRTKYCVGSGDFGGTAWGNSTAISNVDSMRTWMQSTMGARVGKVALLGVSMGATTALNYTLAYPANVACVAAILPAINVNDFYVNNRLGLASSVATAYGGSWNEATFGPTHNPVDFASSITVPVRFWYSTADTAALPTFVAQFVTACPSASATVISTTLNHGEAAVAAAPINDVLAFIAANL